jgi:hypothetical protein
LLCAFQLDVVVSRVVMRHEPALYDQVFLLQHLGILLFDLWGGWAVPLLLGVVLAVWLLVRGVRALLASIALALELPARAGTSCIAAALWAMTIVVSLAAVPSPVSWLAPGLARATATAYRVQRAIENSMLDSPYRGYLSLHLQRKPRVLFFFVESYGRVMASDPMLAATLRQTTSRMESSLSAAGYHFASAYSEAPISGGRSWLAHCSVLTGIRISYQALFQRLTADGHAQVPSLVEFFRRQGYRTLLLGPADRERAGLPSENPYGYDRQLGFDDLHYAGPAFGWGRVPDQYTLTFAREHAWSQAQDAPLFSMLMLVSSHATWQALPRLLNDPQSARDGHAYTLMPQASVSATTPKSALDGTVGRELERYSHAFRLPKHAVFRPELRAGYAQSIAYDLELLRRELLLLHGDDLIVIMGDHQPPLVTPETADTAVPVHVLARDPALLSEFLAHGFTPRLALDPRAPSVLQHSGLFSLLVRDLVQAGAPGTKPPPFSPDGVQLDDGHS